MISLYLIVEGRRTEPALFKAWIPYLLPGFCRIHRIEDAADKTFFIRAGHGYPCILRRIEDAVNDIAINQPGKFSHLVVCVDAESAPIEKTRAEISNSVSKFKCPIPSNIIIANCCIETWLLGHRKMVCRQPNSATLASMLRHYNVVEKDPELMPSDSQHVTQAQFHLRYLKEVFAERKMRYTKNSPGDAQSKSYFDALRERALDESWCPQHLTSFVNLLKLPEWITTAS